MLTFLQGELIDIQINGLPERVLYPVAEVLYGEELKPLDVKSSLLSLISRTIH
jgi:hypothetical protein